MKSLSLGYKILFVLNNIFAILLILSYFTTFISPLVIKSSAFLNFSIPVLWGINLLFVLLWLFKLKKQVFLSIIAILLGWFHIQKVVVFKSAEHQYGDGLKLMSYNVMQFYSKEDIYKSTYSDINAFVNAENPDILCTQEFLLSDKNPFPDFIYKTENRNSERLKTIIFSKYPIVNYKNIDFGQSSNNSAVYADILVKNDTIRVFSIHYESLNLNAIIENKRQLSNERLAYKLGKTFIKQANQFELIKPYIQNSPYPVIIGADMNNTALSYLYRQMESLELQDSFLSSGQGYGRTFNLGILPLRIDMIYHDKLLRSSKFKTYSVKHSDHFPIMVDVHL